MYNEHVLTNRDLLGKGQRDEQQRQPHGHAGHHLVKRQLRPHAAVPVLTRVLQQEVAEHILGGHVGDGHLEGAAAAAVGRRKKILLQRGTPGGQGPGGGSGGGPAQGPV